MLLTACRIAIAVSLLTATLVAPAATSAASAAPADHATAGHVAMPASIDLAHARRVDVPGLATATGCAWYVVAGDYKTSLNLSMSIEVLGMYGSGGYCGRASDHVCATPSDNSYRAGLLIWNWWYADGTYQRTIQNYFQPSAGQTVCSYSGGFNAASGADADGEFVQENAPGYQKIAGQYGVHGWL